MYCAHTPRSGHTHGGQVFPVHLAVWWRVPYVSGIYKVDNTNQDELDLTVLEAAIEESGEGQEGAMWA